MPPNDPSSWAQQFPSKSHGFALTLLTFITGSILGHEILANTTRQNSLRSEPFQHQATKFTKTRQDLKRKPLKMSIGTKTRRFVKNSLASVGTKLPASAVNQIALASGYISVGNWVRQRGYDNAPRVNHRERVFEAMLDIVGTEAVAYLEFGVFEGASLKYWAKRLTNPDSVLVGFDSFEGLPETFDATYEQGHFNRDGQPPTIDDPRVNFQVGWFNDTLPTFQVPPDRRLVLTMDADLYSSTKFVLDTLTPHIRTGTLIYFDELSRVDHEPAAFDDFQRSSGRKFEPVAFERNLNTGAFICTSDS